MKRKSKIPKVSDFVGRKITAIGIKRQKHFGYNEYSDYVARIETITLDNGKVYSISSYYDVEIEESFATHKPGNPAAKSNK